MGIQNELELLLSEDYIILVQQTIATETATISIEELEFRNRELDRDVLQNNIDELIDAGYLNSLHEDTPEGIPSTFYEGTEKLENDLKEIGLWEGIGLWYQLYNELDRTEEIAEIEKHKPKGQLTT